MAGTLSLSQDSGSGNLSISFGLPNGGLKTLLSDAVGTGNDITITMPVPLTISSTLFNMGDSRTSIDEISAESISNVSDYHTNWGYLGGVNLTPGFHPYTGDNKQLVNGPLFVAASGGVNLGDTTDVAAGSLAVSGKVGIGCTPAFAELDIMVNVGEGNDIPILSLRKNLFDNKLSTVYNQADAFGVFDYASPSSYSVYGGLNITGMSSGTPIVPGLILQGFMGSSVIGSNNAPVEINSAKGDGVNQRDFVDDSKKMILFRNNGYERISFNGAGGITSSPLVGTGLRVLGADSSGLITTAIAGTSYRAPHGWPISSTGVYDVSLSYNPATRQVTITPTGATYGVVINGITYTYTGAQVSTAHTDATGNYFIYYNSSGVLVTSPTVWNFFTDVPVASIYYNSTLVDGLPLRELHTKDRNLRDHYYEHFNEGLRIPTAGAITGYTPNVDSVDAVTYSIAPSVLHDEDAITTTDTLPDGGPYVILYRNGSGTEWRWTKIDTLPYHAGTYIKFNNLSGGSWTETESSNGRFMCTYHWQLPAITGLFQNVIIPGQTDYATLSEAQSEQISNLNLTSLPVMEMGALYKIIWRTGASYTGVTGRVQIAQVSRVVGNTVSATLGAATTGITGSLTATYIPVATGATSLANTGMTYVADVLSVPNLTVVGSITGSFAAESTDVDKFLVDSTGVIKYRTGAQVLSDIGACPALSLTQYRIPRAATANTLGDSCIYTDAGNTMVGIGGAPSFRFHVATNTNGAEILGLVNSNAGSGAYSRVMSSNGTSSINMFHFGEGYSTTTQFGLTAAGLSVLSGDGSAGVVVGTPANTPLYFGTNNAVCATLSSAGLLGLGCTPTEAKLEIGITASSAAIYSRVANLAHGLTNVYPTDVCGVWDTKGASSSVAYGGLKITGLSNGISANNSTPLTLAGYSSNTTPNEQIIMSGAVGDGAGNVVEIADNKKILSVRNHSTEKVSIKGNGDITTVGNVSAVDGTFSGLTAWRIPVPNASKTLVASPLYTDAGNTMVGIGTVPSYDLHIQQSRDNFLGSFIKNTSTLSNAYAGSLLVNNADKTLGIYNCGTSNAGTICGVSIAGLAMLYSNNSAGLMIASDDASGKILFATNNAVRATITADGNLGLGFTSPLAKLAINGGLHVGGESDPGDNNLLVDGMVGIGVAPSYDFHIQKLVYGGVVSLIKNPLTEAISYAKYSAVNDADKEISLLSFSSNFYGFGFGVSQAGFGKLLSSSSTGLAIEQTGLAPIYVSAGGFVNCIFHQNGYTAIGYNSTPLAPLHVISGATPLTMPTGYDGASTALFEGYNFPFGSGVIRPNVSIVTEDSQSIDRGGSIGFGGRWSTTDNTIAIFGMIKGGKAHSIDNNYQGYLAFGARTNGVSSIAEGMRLRSGGHLDVASSLHVGSIAVSLPGDNNFSVDGNATIGGNTTVSGEISTVNFTDYTSSSTITGFIGYTTKKVWYKKVGKTVKIWFNISGASSIGAEGGFSFDFTAPYASANITDYYVTGTCWYVINNSVAQTDLGLVIMSPGTSTVNVYRNGQLQSWTAAGDKRAIGYIEYETD